MKKIIKNLFTIRDLSATVVSKVRGTYKDLGRVLLELHNEYNEENHLALCIVNQMENTASDNDIEFDSLKWQDYIDDIADSVLNCNAPFVYKDNEQVNMTEYPEELYNFIEFVAKEECEKHFTKKAQESSSIIKLLNKQLNDIQRQLSELSEEMIKLDNKQIRLNDSLRRIEEAMVTIKRYEH